MSGVSVGAASATKPCIVTYCRTRIYWFGSDSPLYPNYKPPPERRKEKVGRGDKKTPTCIFVRDMQATPSQGEADKRLNARQDLHLWIDFKPFLWL
jgi:hypothetical protein